MTEVEKNEEVSEVSELENSHQAALVRHRPNQVDVTRPREMIDEEPEIESPNRKKYSKEMGTQDGMKLNSVINIQPADPVSSQHMHDIAQQEKKVKLSLSQKYPKLKFILLGLFGAIVLGLLLAWLIVFLRRDIEYKPTMTYTHKYDKDGKLVETKIGILVEPNGFGSSQVPVKVNVVKDEEISQGGRLLQGGQQTEIDSHDGNQNPEEGWQNSQESDPDSGQQIPESPPNSPIPKDDPQFVMPSNNPSEQVQSEPDQQQNTDDYHSYPYGMLDFLDKERGVTLRFLNPRNVIIYIEIEKLFKWYLTSNPNADKNQSISKLKDQLETEIATLLNLDKDHVTLIDEPIWIGKEQNGSSNVYDIVTTEDQSAQYSNIDAGSAVPTDAQVASVQAMVDVIVNFIRVKIDFVREHGDKLAEEMEFSFNQNVELLVSSEETEVLEGDKEEDKEDMPPEEFQFAPKRPIVIRKVFTSVYAEEPADVKDTKTMSKPFYESLSSCTDEDEKTKICSTEEWKSEQKPFDISEESQARNTTWTTFERLTITLKKNAIKAEVKSNSDSEDNSNLGSENN